MTIRDKIIHRRGPGEDDRKTLVLPYIPGLSENISNSCRGLQVRVFFSSRFTLRSSLTKLKNPIPPWDGTRVIYSIPCRCRRSYVGETGCSLKTCLSKHKRAVRIDDPPNVISVHVNSNTGHYIEWEKSLVLASESNLQCRKLREALLICKIPNNINTDPGAQLKSTWATLISNQSRSREDHTQWLSTLTKLSKA